MKYDVLKQLFPKAPASFFRRNCEDYPEGLHPAIPKPAQRKELVRPQKRNGPRPKSTGARYHIHFKVFSTQPCDWDNIAAGLKKLQDCIVRAGWLPDDGYKVLSGSCEGIKVATKAEHRTEVEIAAK